MGGVHAPQLPQWCWIPRSSRDLVCLRRLAADSRISRTSLLCNAEVLTSGHNHQRTLPGDWTMYTESCLGLHRYYRVYKPGPCICRCGKTHTSQPNDAACARHGHGAKHRAGLVDLCHRPWGDLFWQVAVMGPAFAQANTTPWASGSARLYFFHSHARNPRADGAAHRLREVVRDVQYK